MAGFRKVSEILKHGDKGQSVEEARQAMIDAGQAPKDVTTSRGTKISTETTSPAQQLPQRRAADAPPAAAPTRRLRPTKAKLTAINADGTDGESAFMEAEDASDLNRQIGLAHHQAQKAGYAIRVDLMDNDGHLLDMQGNPVIEAPVVEPAIPQPTQVEPVVEPAAAAAIVEPAQAAQPAATTQEPAVEKYTDEVSKFSVEIRQENGEWVGEISYANGGTEKFTAPSRRELLMKVMVGKANATRKIRELNRRANYGLQVDEQYTLPDYMTQEAYDALPETSQRAVIDTLATSAAQAFKERHPEYYAIRENSNKMLAFLANHKNPGPLPVTFRNLEYAYDEISDDLTPRPAATTVAPAAAPAPAAAVSVPIAQPAAAASGDSRAAAVPVAAPAPAAPAQSAPAPAVRKRASLGLQPGQSSVVDSELDESAQGEGKKPKEPSVADLRKLSEIGKPVSKDLEQAYRESMRQRGQRRQF